MCHELFFIAQDAGHGSGKLLQSVQVMVPLLQMMPSLCSGAPAANDGNIDGHLDGNTYGNVEFRVMTLCHELFFVAQDAGLRSGKLLQAVQVSRE